jgi:hypothetical protein
MAPTRHSNIVPQEHGASPGPRRQAGRSLETGSPLRWGCCRQTSTAHQTSSRSPLKNGCRTFPSADFARYSISRAASAQRTDRCPNTRGQGVRTGLHARPVQTSPIGSRACCNRRSNCNAPMPGADRRPPGAGRGASNQRCARRPSRTQARLHHRRVADPGHGKAADRGAIAPIKSYHASFYRKHRTQERPPVAGTSAGIV